MAQNVWAQWAAAALGAELKSAVEGDAGMRASVPTRAWPETIISQVITWAGSTLCSNGFRMPGNQRKAIIREQALT